MSSARRNDLAMVLLGVVLIIVDQLTKSWVLAYFSSGRAPIPLLGNYLQLEYLPNTGVAFSLLDGRSVMFALIAVAIAVILYLYWHARESGSLLLKLSFGIVLGGAIGNLIDRFAHGFVVDFIHFQIPGVFDFAIFNVADCGITVGVILLALLMWRQGSFTAPDDVAPAPSAAREANAREASSAQIHESPVDRSHAQPSTTSGTRAQAQAGPTLRSDD